VSQAAQPPARLAILSSSLSSLGPLSFSFAIQLAMINGRVDSFSSYNNFSQDTRFHCGCSRLEEETRPSSSKRGGRRLREIGPTHCKREKRKSHSLQSTRSARSNITTTTSRQLLSYLSFLFLAVHSRALWSSSASSAAVEVQCLSCMQTHVLFFIHVHTFFFLLLLRFP